MSCSQRLRAPGRRARRSLAPVVAVCSILVPPLLAAQSTAPAPPPPEVTVEDEITVTATRSPRPVRETPGAVSVIDDEEIRRLLMTNAADLVKFEPGVYVDSEATRLGLGGFVIRGMGGNRVLTRIDGVATGERFEFGPLAIPQSTLDVDALKSVEIVRSAGSALYGSDAMGGVVSLMTKDPADYLAELGGRSYLQGKVGYDGRNRELAESGAVALGAGRWQGSLFATRRDGEETRNQGSRDTRDATRTAPNPQDAASLGAIAKLAFIPGDSSIWTLSGEGLRAEAETEIYSARGVTTPGTTALDADAVDERRRTRVSLAQSLETTGPLFDRAEWRLHAQKDDTEQRTLDELTTAAGRIARRGLFTFEQDGLGGELELQKSLARGHLLTYGVSYTRDRFDQIRDRRDRDLVTGRDDVYRGPLVFPTRYFPESDVEEVGVYLQDEVDLLGGRLKLVPGLRYDRYSLDADAADPVYLAGNAGIEPPVDASSSALSPRLGLVAALPGGLSAFGQYARGFRAPAFSSVNSGFTNVASGYTTLPNPDLEPETSATVEAGLRLTRSRGSASLTLFRNRFHDFIESVATGVNPATRLLEFQPRNVGEVVISGIELGGEARLGQAWTLRASAALIDGENESTEQPLNSIAPASGVLGLRYVRPGHRWGGEVITTLTAGKDEDDVDRTVVRQFAPEGSEVVDLTLFFDPTDRMSLTVGVFNLFDESYFAWPDVIGRTEGSPVLDRYTRPGRSLAAAFRLRR